MQKIEINGTELTAWEDGRIAVRRGENRWEQAETGAEIRLTDGACLPFSALGAEMYPLRTGVGEGFRWVWGAAPGGLALETRAWVEGTTGEVHLELIPLCDGPVDSIRWPAPFLYGEAPGSYSVLPMQQGCLLPAHWPAAVEGIDPPTFFDRHGYMPWLGQVAGGAGWMGIVDTPWDAGYDLFHPAGGPTRLQFVWRESMGRLGSPRRLRLRLVEGGYVAQCKAYREDLRLHGGLRTLAEKALRTPKIARLAGAAVIHTEIKFAVKPEAAIYDHAHPAQNNRLTSFDERGRQLRALAARGLKKAYVHLDGWGVMGYDQQHPDTLPPCPEAGGGDGLRRLGETCRSLGYLFALHDQYRDYYTDAASYDEANAVLDCHGQHPHDCTWNGGDQTFLCASLARGYLCRNYSALDRLGVPLDGAYLDVFSVVALDECLDPHHPMTRRECAAYRCECFDFITARYGIVSSEEPLAGTVDHLALCHHAPHATAPHLNGGAARGIAAPLFNLVFHDCILTPWNISEGEASVMPDGRSGLLYALLNGGMPYLPIDASDEEMEKAAAVAALHETVAYDEMVSHEFLDGETRQRTAFASGTTVTVDFSSGSWEIVGPDGSVKEGGAG